MSRIKETFEKLKVNNRKALIPYVMAGFPFADITPNLMHAMVAGGADVIELGVPFSDPSADGPVIQKAGDRALAAGIGLMQVLDMVRVFRENNYATPVVLMGYANPVERYNQTHPNSSSQPQSFVRDAQEAGVDGVLIVDYPPEECEKFSSELKSAGIDLIFLLAPTSTDDRIKQVSQIATGYVYYVSLKGVTGAGTLDMASVRTMIPRIKEHVKIPVGVGFGIRDPKTACSIGAIADAIVIGSKIIQLIDNQPRDKVTSIAKSFISEIRNALDTATSINMDS
tara:strand:+ start:423 stop:1271 length:849 start_codon:yes stop_codon:yes gene_type:complete